MKQTKKSEIKYIAFDVGGVLQSGKYIESKKIPHNLGVHEYLSKKFKKNLDSWFDSIDTTYGKSMDGSISRKQSIKDLAKNLEASQETIVKLFHKAYKKGFKKNKRLYSIANKLKKKGYGIGVLSDQWYLSADILTSKKNMQNFNPVIVSCFVKVRKPSVKIFKMFIEKCKCKSSEILFIDNRDFNLKPARKLGMRTILFKENKQFLKDLKKIGIEI